MLKLNVGLSRKVGKPDYGSRGASVHLELEVESSFAGDPEALQERIRSLFRLARASIETELNGNGASSHGDGHANGNGQDHNNQSNGSRRSNGRSATASQVRAIHAIASRQRIDLVGELRSRFGVERPEDLSISEASEFIDAIKPQTGGTEDDDDRGTRHLQPEQDRRTNHRTQLSLIQRGQPLSALSARVQVQIPRRLAGRDHLVELGLRRQCAFRAGTLVPRVDVRQRRPRPRRDAWRVLGFVALQEARMPRSLLPKTRT